MRSMTRAILLLTALASSLVGYVIGCSATPVQLMYIRSGTPIRLRAPVPVKAGDYEIEASKHVWVVGDKPTELPAGWVVIEPGIVNPSPTTKP